MQISPRSASEDPTMDQVLRAIQIYSGLEAPEIERRVTHAHGTRRFPYANKLVTAMRYGDVEFGVPCYFCAEIAEAGRRLTDGEVATLREGQPIAV